MHHVIKTHGVAETPSAHLELQQHDRAASLDVAAGPMVHHAQSFAVGKVLPCIANHC